MVFVREEIEGKVTRLHGEPEQPAEVQDSRMLLRAQEIELDSETGDLHAQGDVYFHSLEKNQEIWASRLE